MFFNKNSALVFLLYPLLFYSYIAQDILNISYYFYYPLPTLIFALISLFFVLGFSGRYLYERYQQVFFFISIACISIIFSRFFKNIFSLELYTFLLVSLIIFLLIFSLRKKLNFNIIIFGSFLASFSIVFVSFFYSQKVSLNEDLKSLIEFQSSNIDNLVLLVLDEMNYQDFSEILPKIDGDEKYIFSGSRPGINTADAMPKILFKDEISQVRPCGDRYICTKDTIFDINIQNNLNLNKEKNYLIRSFYFPLCKILKGDCKVDNLSPGIEIALACKLATYLKFFDSSCSNKKGKKLQQIFDTHFRDAKYALTNNKRNFILIHVPGMHPPGVSINKNLREDSNLWKDKIVYEINSTLKILKESNYVMAIFSDHPFRHEIWCGDQKYYKDCEGVKSEENIPISLITNIKKEIKKIKNINDLFQSLRSLQ